MVVIKRQLAVITAQWRGCGADEPGRATLTLANAMEEIMRIKRTILAPVVLTLGSLGFLAGSVAPVVASAASGSTVVASSASPAYMYNG